MPRHAFTLAGATLLASAVLSQAATPTQESPAEALGVRPDSMLTSNVVGLEVYEKGNEQQAVGKIADIVIDNNALSGYVLSIGGFPGINERYVAVKPSAVTVSYDASAKKWKAIADVPPEQIKSSPEFKYESKWLR
jgi:hypothetical protein